jgi:hypothetical protein
VIGLERNRRIEIGRPTVERFPGRRENKIERNLHTAVFRQFDYPPNAVAVMIALK